MTRPTVVGKPLSGLDEMRQRRWELRRAHRVASQLAELLEIVGKRTDYKTVRAIAAQLWLDLAALDGSDDLL